MVPKKSRNFKEASLTLVKNTINHEEGGEVKGTYRKLESKSLNKYSS